LERSFAELDEEAANFIETQFYVDDGLKSVKTAIEAIKLIEAACDICKKGNIRLHKFSCNDREAMSSIPSSERAKNATNLDLSFEELPTERVLGVQWNIESDNFEFRITLKDQPLTRRGILSTVASIYDSWLPCSIRSYR
jgi:hypothetical protein